VTFTIDTNHPLRSAVELSRLIHAVVEAAPEDESRSVEWKGGYPDVTAQDASFAISRAILGFANRPVDVASRAFGGSGYLVVGAEPGRVSGQSVPDSAELVAAIRRYTGSGPTWDPVTVKVEAATVLVVIVAPPRPGDRIALLAKSYQPSRGPLVAEGTVFVRYPGATERATGYDLAALQDRLLDGTALQEEQARRTIRREKAREYVNDFVTAGHIWGGTMENLLIMSDKIQDDSRFWIDYLNTDAGKALASARETAEKAARSIRLLVDDAELQERVATAHSLLSVSGGLAKGMEGTGSSEERAEHRRLGYRHLGALDRALNATEERAVKMLRESLDL
jgi:hypothetical protein